MRKGWINGRGQVTKLLGGIAEPEPNYQTWTMEDDVSGRENGPVGHDGITAVAATDHGATD